MYRIRTRFRSVPGPRVSRALGALLIAAACGGDSSGPAAIDVRLVAGGGTPQFGTPGNLLADSFAVLVLDAATGRPVDAVEVRWRVAQGSGTLSAASTTTDGTGVTRTLLRLGNGTGDVRVEADADRRTGAVASFDARAVATPVLSSVSPLPAPAGGSVTVQGQNFSTTAADHTVLFGGRRGTVRSATATSLTVDVPACLPDRSVPVQVRLGAVGSNTLATEIDGQAPAPVTLARGQWRAFDDDASLACLALDGTPGSSFLVVGLNVDPDPGVGMPWQLSALAGAPLALTAVDPPLTHDAASQWELNVRALERAIPPGPPPAALRPQGAGQTILPDIGDRTDFNVLNRQNRTDRITAEVRAISDRAILYVDVAAPANGLTQDDLDRFGRIFDDPIHPVNVATYGTPSDIDGNGKIIILLTPRVNALTERSQNSFIAGFFYGCDLVSRERCSDSNRAEIFYSMVPDPAGEFSSPRTRQTVLNTVPGVLAHEFQHMIAFGRKGRLDLLWLSEGLAHMAEERVGRVFLERGLTGEAEEFRRANWTRARNYLLAPSRISLTDEDSPGSLELRGAAWLFVQYLAEQYGGDGFLSRITGATQLGADNVAAQTGRAWVDVFTEFTLAMWTSGAPELAGVAFDPRLTFGTFDLRAAVATGGIFPLRPEALSYADVTREGTLPQAAPRHFLFTAQSFSLPPFTLSFAGRWGGAFAAGDPRLAVLRVR